MFKTVITTVYAVNQPDTFRIQRTASIKAPPERDKMVGKDFEAGLAALKAITEK